MWTPSSGSPSSDRAARSAVGRARDEVLRAFERRARLRLVLVVAGAVEESVPAVVAGVLVAESRHRGAIALYSPLTPSTPSAPPFMNWSMWTR